MAKTPLGVKVESLLELLARELDIIEAFGDIKDLTWSAVRKRSDSPIAATSLASIRRHGENLSSFFDAMLLAGDGPLVVVDGTSARFYYDRYLPNLETLDRLWRESHWPEDRLGPFRRRLEPRANLQRRAPEDHDFLPLEIEDLGSVSPGVTLGDFIRHVYQAAEAAIDWDDVEGDRDAHPYGLEVLESRWFRPERWVENSLRVRPMFVSRDVSPIPQWVQGPLREAFDCLIQDLHLAAIALCRSVVETAMIDRAPHFGIEASEITPNGNRFRRARDLAHDFAERMPTLATSLHSVLNYGNQALHAPTKHPRPQNIVTPATADHFSFNCFRHLRRIVEGLYSSPSPRPNGDN